MIKIEHLSKKFRKLTVLSDISIDITGGSCVALIGPNASGKTTLIKSILGLVIPDKGNIYLKGQLLKGEWAYRKYIGYMPQIGRYPDNITIGQLFKMLMNVRKTNFFECDTELLERFEIKKIEDKRMGTLSGGTRQKVSACIAFLFNPDILILDEPTAGLDPVAAELLKEKIEKEKTRGKSIIITSHVLSELDGLVNEVIYLADGKIDFHKNIEVLKIETGETRLSRAIAKIMGYKEVNNVT